MVRNSRRSAANNRIWRASPGTIEWSIKEAIENLQEKLQLTLIPEFGDQVPLNMKRPLAQDFPAQYLINLSDLPNHGVKDQLLYHGTPNAENALAIMRGGLMLSANRNANTVHVYGRGSYSSPNEKIAQKYAGANGLMFDLKIKAGARILDWEQARKDPWFQDLAKKIGDNDLDAPEKLFEHLGREYGIDIIKNQHFLIQNAEAVITPKTISELLNAYYSGVNNPVASFSTRIGAFDNYGKLLVIAQALGENSFRVLTQSEDQLFAEIIKNVLNDKITLDERDERLFLKRIFIGSSTVNRPNYNHFLQLLSADKLSANMLPKVAEKFQEINDWTPETKNALLELLKIDANKLNEKILGIIGQAMIKVNNWDAEMSSAWAKLLNSPNFSDLSASNVANEFRKIKKWTPAYTNALLQFLDIDSSKLKRADDYKTEIIINLNDWRPEVNLAWKRALASPNFSAYSASWANRAFAEITNWTTGSMNAFTDFLNAYMAKKLEKDVNISTLVRPFLRIDLDWTPELKKSWQQFISSQEFNSEDVRSIRKVFINMRAWPKIDLVRAVLDLNNLLPKENRLAIPERALKEFGSILSVESRMCLKSAFSQLL